MNYELQYESANARASYWKGIVVGGLTTLFVVILLGLLLPG